MSINIKLTSTYKLFVIYDDQSHYLSTNNIIMEKKQSYVRRIYFSYTWREDLKTA